MGGTHPIRAKERSNTPFFGAYYKQKAVTIRDTYPTPCMDECIDIYGNDTILSSLHANSGYWELCVAEEDSDRTAFASHHGPFRFTGMSFGLKSHPRTFQRVIDIKLSSVKVEFAVDHPDDIVIFLKSPKEYVN